MSHRIQVTPHLSLADLEVRYRQCHDPVERSHTQIIWLLAQGRSALEVSAVTSYSRNWIYELARSYNREGPEALVDYRHQHPGRLTLLDDEQQALLLQVLQRPPADGGQWNGRKVADWMSQLLGRPIGRQRGWEYLKAMEYRLRVPRPENPDADPAVQADWEKKVADNSGTGAASLSRRRRGSMG
jgi:transposase